MPLYDYDCAACGRRFEVIHGVHADPPTACPLCGSGPVRKAFAAPAIHFKGSGWAKKERRSAARSKDTATKEGAESSPSAGGSDGDAAGAASGSSASGGAASGSTPDASSSTKPKRSAESSSAGSD